MFKRDDDGILHVRGMSGGHDSTIMGFLLGTAVSSIFSFFLGTTQANKTKDTAIANLSANK